MTYDKSSLDDYIDVAERIVQFRGHYPDGSLQAYAEPTVMTIGDKTFIKYTAAAYRTPDDHRPGIGTAWEPFPGTTPYTRNSELMNAETAAWGRAIVALGIVANRKIASKQEVQARAAEDGRDVDPVESRKMASPSQKSRIKRLITDHNPPKQVLSNMLSVIGFDGEVAEGWTEKLTASEAHQLIDHFVKTGTLPAPDAQDIPNDLPAPVDADWDEAMAEARAKVEMEESRST